MSKLLLNIDKKLHRKFKIAVAKNDTTMTSAIIEFIEDYIEKEKKGKNNEL